MFIGAVVKCHFLICRRFLRILGTNVPRVWKYILQNLLLSGMRQSCDVLIYIDLPRALQGNRMDGATCIRYSKIQNVWVWFITGPMWIVRYEKRWKHCFSVNINSCKWKLCRGVLKFTSVLLNMKHKHLSSEKWLNLAKISYTNTEFVDWMLNDKVDKHLWV